MELIDRVALLKYIDSLSTHWLNSWDTMGVLDVVLKQPTIDAALVVHARWGDAIGHITDVTEYADYVNCLALTEMDIEFRECGHCGVLSKMYKTKRQRFCKCCGARMDADAPERAGKEARHESSAI